MSAIDNTYQAGIAKMVKSNYKASACGPTLVEWLGGRSCVEEALQKGFAYARRQILNKRSASPSYRPHYKTLFAELASLPHSSPNATTLFGAPPRSILAVRWSVLGPDLDRWMAWYSAAN